MKKMMVLTLALSVMMVGNAMAMSGAEVRGPERVKINVSIDGRHDGRYADMLHLMLCRDCRVRLAHGHAVCDRHKIHHRLHRGDGKGYPKHRHDGVYRGKDNGPKGDRGHGRENDKGHGRENDKGHGRR